MVAIILRLFAHLKEENKNNATISTYSPESRLIAYTGLSKGLRVTRILGDYHREGQIPKLNPQHRGRKASGCPSYVQRDHLLNIRRTINEMNIAGEGVTLAKLEKIASEKIQ